ncbi:MAG: hypothetical protein ACYSWT_18180 [Planctomycetota bacterium]
MTKNATGAPRRSNRAFVPRVVASRISTSGRGAPGPAPVTILAARIGASTPQRISKQWPPGQSGTRP